MNQSQIRTAMKTFLDSVVGTPHTFTLTFDDDLITDNVITGDFNGLDFLSITFATSYSATMQQLAFAFQNLESVRSATVTGDDEITVEAMITNTEIVATVTVTGGATQAIVTQDTVTEWASVPVFRMNQKITQYPEQCAFNIINVSPFGVDGYRNVNTDTNLSLLAGSRIATISVDYTGVSAIDKASRIYAELYSERANIYFNGLGIAIAGREPIKDLTGLLDTEFQERADFDFYIRYFDTTSVDLGSIETVVVDETIDEVTYTETIT